MIKFNFSHIIGKLEERFFPERNLEIFESFGAFQEFYQYSFENVFVEVPR